MDPPIFTTLGLFVIDDNLYPGTDRPSEHDIIGGGASYALVGGRIISGPQYGHRITGIIDRGSDFPPAVDKELASWDTGMVFRTDPTRLTTRGANIYIDDIRHFEFRTSKIRIEARDVVANPWLLGSRVFHMCCTVERAEQIIDTINLEVATPPVYVFEPFPADCVPERMELLARVLQKIDVFTPNLDEACALLGVDKPATDYLVVTSQFQQHMKIPNSGTLVRCGADGCYIHTVDGLKAHLPAYHQDQTKVVDVTGGGNTFCGAFGVAFELSHGDWLTAAICGNVASGCVIERLGVPRREPGTEVWNGVSVADRIRVYTQAYQAETPESEWTRLAIGWLTT
ncbi:Ribokinase-like protein [Suhomyces tanzawaensis NRRL Y-17324]|uniref:Ribokinase-like protein n=1 Tax=Suhomyces tanzawaensis NRRL Y-17324 TaxID=984487 RepID=A0A1E4SD29_9ASCO|nr:Ribokinase-like protein [Suhomyces tanzawaensis NRRL Y-17324]ODV77376.1 Ribokinase-like protein [Suhomyces tanzawaensis NRRL Y-17324]